MTMKTVIVSTLLAFGLNRAYACNKMGCELLAEELELDFATVKSQDGKTPPGCVEFNGSLFWVECGSSDCSTSTCKNCKVLNQKCAKKTFTFNAGAECMDGYEPITSNWQDCKDAAEAIGVSILFTKSVKYDKVWPSKPQGCFRDGESNLIRFNQGEGGSAENNDKILCQVVDKGSFPASLPPPSPEPACPETPPRGECESFGMRCEYGEECCCGECHTSLIATCTDGGWMSMYTDACMAASRLGCPGDAPPLAKAEFLLTEAGKKCPSGYELLANEAECAAAAKYLEHPITAVNDHARVPGLTKAHLDAAFVAGNVYTAGCYTNNPTVGEKQVATLWFNPYGVEGACPYKEQSGGCRTFCKATPAPAPCPAGWESFEGNCYRFPDADPEFFKNGVFKGMTWDAAAEWCESMGSFLPSMQTKAEQDFLQSKREGTRWTFWLGIREGAWKTHDGTPSIIAPFAEDYHKPAHCYDAGREKCGRFQGYWSFMNCDNTSCGQYNYPVCVKRQAPAPCPAGLVHFEGNCYRFPDADPERFKSDDPEAMTWDAAAEYCESMGGFLPSMRTKAEQDLLMSVAKSTRWTFWLGIREGAGKTHDGTPSSVAPFAEDFHKPAHCYDAGRKKCGRVVGGYWSFINCDNKSCGQGNYPVCVSRQGGGIKKENGCVDVNHVNDRPGKLTCDCVSPSDPCLADKECVPEPRCPADDGQQATTDKCNLPRATGRCFAAFRRYYHDKASGTCKEFIYGGCGGNDNNFATKQACEKACDVEVPEEVPIPTTKFTCSASSEHSSKYSCKNAFDGKLVTDWATRGKGSGVSYTLNLGAAYTLTKIALRHRGTGSAKAQERFKHLKVTLDDGTVRGTTMSNDLSFNELGLPQRSQTKTIKISVLSVYNPSGYNNHGLSEIRVYGKKIESFKACTAGFTLERNTDYPSNDIKCGQMTMERAKYACLNDKDCLGFSVLTDFIKSGQKLNEPWCLKRKIDKRNTRSDHAMCIKESAKCFTKGYDNKYMPDCVGPKREGEPHGGCEWHHHRTLAEQACVLAGARCGGILWIADKGMWQMRQGTIKRYFGQKPPAWETNVLYVKTNCEAAPACARQSNGLWEWDGATPDKDKNCDHLPASSHGCNQPWMQNNCAETCGRCAALPKACEKRDPNWKWDGETPDFSKRCGYLPSNTYGCDRPWMQQNCARTCGTCKQQPSLPRVAVGNRGGNECPSGYQPIENKMACTDWYKGLRRYGAIPAGNQRQPSGNWHWVPPYCSYQSGGDGSVHYNTHTNGKNDGGYTPICTLDDDDCYIGCYVDDSKRDFEKRLGRGYDVDKCRSGCEALKYKFFGVQHYDECFCGNAFATEPQYQRVPDSQCDRGTKGKRRGSAWRNSVYQVVCINNDPKTNLNKQLSRRLEGADEGELLL